MPRYLDSDDFPFTRAELQRALGLAWPAGEAATLAEDIAEMIVSTHAEQHSAAEARAAGSRDPQDLNPAQWHLGPEIYALLWCLPECSSRVDRLMESEWSQVEASYVRSLSADSEARVPDPVRAARRMTAPARRGWTRRKRAMADRLGLVRPDGSEKIVRLTLPSDAAA